MYMAVLMPFSLNESQNHIMVCLGRVLKYNLVPTLPSCTGTVKRKRVFFATCRGQSQGTLELPCIYMYYTYIFVI